MGMLETLKCFERVVGGYNNSEERWLKISQVFSPYLCFQQFKNNSNSLLHIIMNHGDIEALLRQLAH